MQPGLRGRRFKPVDKKLRFRTDKPVSLVTVPETQGIRRFNFAIPAQLFHYLITKVTYGYIFKKDGV